jgi:hypothetical protein
MVHIELEPHDAEVLRLALENYLSELRMEIANTDSLDYREELKARKAVLRRIVGMVGGIRSEA